MGWQDRDYAREYDARPFSRVGGVGYRSRSVVTTLIVVNVVLFVLCSISISRRRFGIISSPIFDLFAMQTTLVLRGQVWRVLTSDYLHWNTMHLFVNMLGLYFLGRPLEQVWGPKKFFGVYTAAGVLGSLFYMAIGMVGWLDPRGIAAGASGCVLGLLGAAAVLFPHAEVLVYFLFPVRIRTAAAVLGLFYVLNLLQRGPNAGGDACHLVGLIFGVWWAVQGDAWYSTWRSGARIPRASRPSFRERLAQRKSDAELVDRILQKINTSGIASLSDSEKRALADATRRQQADDRRYGRVDRL